MLSEVTSYWLRIPSLTFGSRLGCSDPSSDAARIVHTKPYLGPGQFNSFPIRCLCQSQVPRGQTRPNAYTFSHGRQAGLRKQTTWESHFSHKSDSRTQAIIKMKPVTDPTAHLSRTLDTGIRDGVEIEFKLRTQLRKRSRVGGNRQLVQLCPSSVRLSQPKASKIKNSAPAQVDREQPFSGKEALDHLERIDSFIQSAGDLSDVENQWLPTNKNKSVRTFGEQQQNSKNRSTVEFRTGPWASCENEKTKLNSFPCQEIRNLNRCLDASGPLSQVAENANSGDEKTVVSWFQPVDVLFRGNKGESKQAAQKCSGRTPDFNNGEKTLQRTKKHDISWVPPSHRNSLGCPRMDLCWIEAFHRELSLNSSDSSFSKLCGEDFQNRDQATSAPEMDWTNRSPGKEMCLIV